MKDNEDPLPRKPSSWAAAIAQLPGYPGAKPKLPPVADGTVREVSMGMDHEDDQHP